MSSSLQTRADARALMVAVVSGAGLSLLLAAAFFAGDAAGEAADAAQRLRLNEANQRTLAGIVADIAVRQDAAPSSPINLNFLRPAVLDPSAPVASSGRRPMRDADCLTAAVYYEARGEPEAGQAAVAQVVLNRVRHAGFPKSVCGVVYQGAATGACQFTFACDGSMDRAREAGAWRRAREVAERALSGYVMDAVGEATHYHTANLGEIWGDALIKVAQVGQHIFYSATGRHRDPDEPLTSPPAAPPPATPAAASAATADPVQTITGDAASLVSSTPATPTPAAQSPPAPGAS